MPFFRKQYGVGFVFRVLTFFILLVIFLPDKGTAFINPVTASSMATVKKVNAPYLGLAPPTDSFTPAIFWLGKVTPASNYADVRIYYYSEVLKIVVHIIDRRLWYDTSVDPTQLPDWDSVSIYLDQNGNVGNNPRNNSYRLELELGNDLQATYRGNGTDWVNVPVPVDAYTEWRGADGPNSDADSEGWVAYYSIPFASLGLSEQPGDGTIWGLGVVMHDRDDAAGDIRENTLWPSSLSPNVPSTWGQLSFGENKFIPPKAVPVDTVTIRQGLNGSSVVDAEVGGHTTCGNDGYNKWTEWGNLNYAGGTQFNIQNQWDVSDWPCFSKFYITFPVTSIPKGFTIISATLTMSLFGTAGGGEYGDPPTSYIEVMTISDDWTESSITWNNAPLATENISGTWVPPVIGDYSWDISRAVQDAYNSGIPLRLVIYSIDGERHSGKYFFSSDSDDWNGEVRPTLKVQYGSLCSSPEIICKFTFLPIISQ